jgi:hypothetical protein
MSLMAELMTVWPASCQAVRWAAVTRAAFTVVEVLAFRDVIAAMLARAEDRGHL